MSKKPNTFLFVLAGTLLNIFLMAFFFVLFLFAYSIFLHKYMPEGAVIWVLAVLFIVALAASFFLYRLLIKIIMRKLNIDLFNTHQT